MTSARIFPLRITLVVLLTAATLAACAAGSAGNVPSASSDKIASRCTMESADSALVASARSAPVYLPCGVDKQAVPIGEHLALNYNGNLSSCVVAEVVMVVDSTGTVDQGAMRVARSNDTEFATVVMNEARASHYQPALKDGKTVSQLVKVGAKRSAAVVVPAGSRPSRATMRAGC